MKQCVFFLFLDIQLHNLMFTFIGAICINSFFCYQFCYGVILLVNLEK